MVTPASTVAIAHCDLAIRATAIWCKAYHVLPLLISYVLVYSYAAGSCAADPMYREMISSRCNWLRPILGGASTRSFHLTHGWPPPRPWDLRDDAFFAVRLLLAVPERPFHVSRFGTFAVALFFIFVRLRVMFGIPILSRTLPADVNLLRECPSPFFTPDSVASPTFFLSITLTSLWVAVGASGLSMEFTLYLHLYRISVEHRGF